MNENIENRLNSCVNCVALEKSVEKLKQKNILLLDKVLICEQQNIALNHIKVEAFKCLDVLEIIVKKLETIDANCGTDRNEEIGESVDKIKNEVKPKVELITNEILVLGLEPEVEAIPECVAKPDLDRITETESKPELQVIGIDSDLGSIPEPTEQSVDELKEIYYNVFHDLDDWVKQLDQINQIKSYPRFECDKYVDKPQTQTQSSNRVAFPVIQFMPIAIKKEKDLFKKLQPEEIECLTNGRIECPSTPSTQRLSCPYPKCGFTTRRGPVGLTEHSLERHKRHIPTSSEVLTPTAASTLTSESGLHCSYPNCNYVTYSGKVLYNLKKHIYRIHTKTNRIKVTNDLTQNKATNIPQNKSLIHCPYSGCNYTTNWGINLKRHISSDHRTKPTNRPKPLTSTALINKIKAQTPKLIENNIEKFGNRCRPVLRCNKCCYKSPGGLSKLRNHMKIHNREEPFKCDGCDASFANNGTLIQHKRNIHNIRIIKPKRLNNKWKNECNVCQKNFRYSSDLRAHERKAHKKENQPKHSVYDCPHTDCAFSADKIGLLQKHVITHIKKKPEIKSEEQNELKDQNSDYKVVVKEEVEEVYDIEENVAIHETIDSDILPDGTEDSNLGSNPDQSSEVTNKTNKKRKLRSTAKKSVNTNGFESLELDASTPLAKRLMQSLFKCNSNDCSFTSTNFEDWVKHNDWHQRQEKKGKDGSMRFKCIRCPKSYAKLNLLKAHQRLKRHSSFDCGNCDEMFKSSAQLRVHILSKHTNEEMNESAIESTTVQNKQIQKETPVRNDEVSNTGIMLGSELHKLLANQSKESNPSNESIYISCPYVKCNQRFKLRAHMITHFNKNHKHIKDETLINIEENDYSQCHECQQLFNCAANMKRHRSQAHKLKSSPESIAISTINPEIFNTSVNETYSESKGYFCNRNGCGKWFESAIDLRHHLNIEHNRAPNRLSESHPQPQPEPQPEPEPELCDQPLSTRCDICDINMSSAEELDLHFKYVHFQSEPQVIPNIDSEDINEDLYVDQWLPHQQAIHSGLEFEGIVEENCDTDYNPNGIISSIKTEMF